MIAPRLSFAAPRLLPVTLLAGSLAAGIAYPLINGPAGIAITALVKGLAVGLLAAAATRLATPQRWWLAAIMAAGALGDVLLNIPGLFYAGAAAFALGHGTAILFYRRHRRVAGKAEHLAAVAILLWGAAMPALVSPAGTALAPLMVYSVLLCAMAAALLLSRFPRLALVGALLFILSDMLLIMRMGGHLVGDAQAHGLLVWFSYYLGQLLIFLGVAAGLSKGTAR
ncbi:lysoplasmalogenase family protein [Polymorphobacter fuscus]|nr:lysoplasmalogenase family protein [Polymorphobacter fuscus]NJC07424.1 putative membrane protein YhhN [Polymorphobacter fuscus]